jgi:aminobenzoyl-glutamate utilization protein A
MLEKAKKILEQTAAMYDQTYDFRLMGGCKGGESDAEMVAIMRRAAEQVAYFDPELIEDSVPFGASDDVSEFMAAVQAQGGIASYGMIGTELSAGHHNFRFDFNEQVMAPASEFLLRSVLLLCKR